MMTEHSKQLAYNHGPPWPIAEGFSAELQLHVEKAWVWKVALVSNDLSKHQEFRTFSNKQNTMLKVLAKTYLVKHFDWNR